MNLKTLDNLRAVRNMLIFICVALSISIVISLLFGCAEMPDREMNEYMQCIMIDDNEAFCS